MTNSIFTRTSIRKYQDKLVEKYKITNILKAAMVAPSAGNQQPWEFYIIQNKDILYELSKCSPYSNCVEKSPCAFVVCYKDEAMFPEYAQIDCAICCENILLEIENQNLGGVP